MEKFDISEYYKSVVRENQDISSPIAAIKALTEYIKHSSATTMSEFMQNLKSASVELQSSARNAIAISAGCDLFLHFVTRTGHDLSVSYQCFARPVLLSLKGNFFTKPPTHSLTSDI